MERMSARAQRALLALFLSAGAHFVDLVSRYRAAGGETPLPKLLPVTLRRNHDLIFVALETHGDPGSERPH